MGRREFPTQALDARYLLLEVWEMSLAEFLARRQRPLGVPKEAEGREPDGENGEKVRRYRELIGTAGKADPPPADFGGSGVYGPALSGK